MDIKQIDFDFSICKVLDFSMVNFNDEYVFVSKTDEENSLVCKTQNTPSNTIQREDGFKAFKIQGVLDFSLIGILSKISTLLANGDIGIFAISTYNTDYILTKKQDYKKALDILSKNGYNIV